LLILWFTKAPLCTSGGQSTQGNDNASTIARSWLLAKLNRARATGSRGGFGLLSTPMRSGKAAILRPKGHGGRLWVLTRTFIKTASQTKRLKPFATLDELAERFDIRQSSRQLISGHIEHRRNQTVSGP
jgi:hypothetical protein